VHLCLKTGIKPASEMRASLKNEMMDEVPKKKTVSVNFSHAVFSLLFIHDNLVMQALVWLHEVQFRASRFGVVWFGFSSMNLRSPHISKCQV